MKRTMPVAALLLLISCFMMAGCGGGSGSSEGNAIPAGSPVTGSQSLTGPGGGIASAGDHSAPLGLFVETDRSPGCSDAGQSMDQAAGRPCEAPKKGREAGKAKGITSADIIGSWSGGSSGVWSYYAGDGTWTYVNVPAACLALGDVVGNDGKDDIIGSWIGGASGTWVRNSNGGGWLYLNIPARSLAVGNFHGTGKELLCSFDNGAPGTYTYNFTTHAWTYINISADALAAADLDGDGKDDIIGSWTGGSSGTWVRYSNGGAWEYLNISATTLASGNFHGTGSELLCSFDNGAPGTYTYNFTTHAWTYINIPATALAAADVDGDGKDDIIGSWSSGTYVRYSATGTWSYLNIPATALAGGYLTNAHNPPVTKKKWTVLVYMAGDNTLASFIDLNLNWMEMAGSSADVNFVALVDKPGVTTKRYYITHDNDPLVTSAFIDLGSNIDTGNVSSLNAFVNQAFTDFPADHYALVLWNHGAGFKNLEAGGRVPRGTANRTSGEGSSKGICWDDTSGHHITTMQVRQSLESYKAALGRKIDIIATDACLMQGIEDAYEWLGSDHLGTCDYLVGSEETIPGNGFPYNLCFAPLVSNPDMSAHDCACAMVDAYGAYYGTNGDGKQTLSAIDMSRIPALYTSVDTFASVLKLDNKVRIRNNCYMLACYFYDNELIDLYDFAYKSTTYGNAGTKAAATDVMAKVNDAVVRKYNGSKYAAAGGISVWGYYTGTIPAGSIYRQLLFFPNTWSSFIDWINS
jgi:hypothetical protein